MELLVVTLAQINPMREVDALARMRIISDTIRSAPGLLNARFYRSRAPDISYCMLTTWESVEWWQKAQERHSPLQLLLSSPEGIFHTPPDQWLMQYLWGYSRPMAQPTVAAAHLALVRPEIAARVQQEWLESLRQQAVEPILSFALLARNIEEDPETYSSSPMVSARFFQAEGALHHSVKLGSMFFNLLSWPGEQYREDFYANESYQSMQGLLTRTGMIHILTLDPL